MPKALRVASSLALVALLAACANHTPRLNATQQAREYQSNASGDYAPPGPPSDPWGPYIAEASHRFDVPQSWIRNVMHTESGGHQYINGQLVTSGVGAMGLMQVMPETYQELASQYSLGDDPFAPHDNIMAGTAYLREMYDLFGSPGFLAAYNAGPQRLNQYLTDGRPLPAETTHYVAMIAPYIGHDMPGGQSPADRFAMSSMTAPSARPYNGGATASPSLANSGGGAVSGNLMVASRQYTAPSTGSSADDLNGQQVAMAANTDGGSSADDLNGRQVAIHGAQLAASGGGAVPADLMVAMNDPRPTAAQVAQQELDSDAASQTAMAANGPVAVQQTNLNPVVQAAADQRPVFTTAPVAPVRQAPVYTPVRVASSQPLPPPAAPSVVVQPVAVEQRLPAPPPPAPMMQVAAYTPPVRRVVVPNTVGPMGTRNLANEMGDAPVTTRSGGFHLITPAMADTLPSGMGHGGGWAIQVGAYGSAGDARQAVTSARQHGYSQLAAARTFVMPVHAGSNLLYRARLTGLSPDAARNACSTLSHGRTPCMVLSPDAQND